MSKIHLFLEHSVISCSKMPDAYRELEEMGVNIDAVREANLTEIELVDLTKALRRLLGNRGVTSSKSVIDVA